MAYRRWMLTATAVTVSIVIPGGRSQERTSVLDLVRQGKSNLQLLRETSATYSEDGRMPIVDIYRAQCELQKRPGWILEEVFREVTEAPGGGTLVLPATCLRTARKGPALWILAGIHGEEPAGPNALAENLAVLESLDRQKIPLVILPLLNPIGYQRNWRYPDVAVYSEATPGSSVGDSEHLLPDDKGKPRRGSPACREAGMLTSRVLELARDYPPVLSLDLHEDNLLQKGYVYSQGRRGADDPVARDIVGLFSRLRFPILLDGKTRFGETVRHGIVADVKDGSIDELLGAPTVLVQGVPRKGPGGRSVLVLETSSMSAPLAERKRVHAAVLTSLGALWRKAHSIR